MNKMDQRILCKPVKDVNDLLLEQVEKTYINSFPVMERREFADLCKLINSDIFTIYTLCSGEQYIGFITSWQWNDFIYIEHFAIEESARNGGMGGKAMTEFLISWDKPVVLEVEAPVDEMSKRRIGFYERLGFKLDDHSYQQPPYRQGESWLDMCLMSYGDINLMEQFETVKQYLYKYVYGVKDIS